MKLLKILGIVAAVHAAAFLLLFATQGCRSTTKSEEPAPAVVETQPATVQYNAASPVSPASAAGQPMSDAALNPATAPADQPAETPAAPAVSGGASVVYSPTRPGTAAAVAIAAPTPVENVTPAETYTVIKGDSLWKIAGKYHMTHADLAKANNLSPDATVKVGQKLIIPGKAAATSGATAAGEASDGVVIYKVKAGDSLKLIAKHNGTTVSAIKSLNHLKHGAVQAGQELKLPAGSTPVAGAAETSEPAPAKHSGGGLTHIVKPGEKLSLIAKKYGVTVGELATANNISDPGKIRAGQELVIPGHNASGEKPARPARAEKPAQAAASEPAAPETQASASPDLDSGLKSSPSDAPPVIKVDGGSPTPPASTSGNP